MLSIRCTLLRDVFEGGQAQSPRLPEWPPSWMRLYSALVSVAQAEQDDRLLRFLESAKEPEIFASSVEDGQVLSSSPRSAFVPTNIIMRTTKHGTLVARSNKERSWPRVAPRNPTVVFRWPELDLSPVENEQLQRLCWRVPYLGRSTSSVMVESYRDVAAPAELQPLVPASRVRSGVFRYRATVRCPFDGALSALREAHRSKYEHGEPADAWAIGKRVEYGVAVSDGDRPIFIGPYRRFVFFRIQNRYLDGRHTARVTYAFRRAILSRAAEHIAPLHGHHDGHVTQVSFVALPFVDAKHADGHLLGIGMLLPELPSEDLAIISRALPAIGEDLHVTAGPLGIIRLKRISPLAATQMPWALQPHRWRGPSRRWVTALPMVFDRFLKKKSNIEAEALRTVTNSGYPEPETITISRRPLVPGGLDLAPQDTLRRRSERGFKPYRHLRIEFAVEVEGPVVVGSMRHYGLGLCVPVSD